MVRSSFNLGGYIESKKGENSYLESPNGIWKATIGVDGILRIGKIRIDNNALENNGGLIWSSQIQFNTGAQDPTTSYRLAIYNNIFGIFKYDRKGNWNLLQEFKKLPPFNPYLNGNPEVKLMNDGILNLYLGSQILWTSYQNQVALPPPPVTPQQPQTPTQGNVTDSRDKGPVRPGSTNTTNTTGTESILNPYTILGGLAIFYFLMKK